MKHPRKITCLTAYPPELTASVRYRVQQYEQGWQKHNIAIQYIPFASQQLQKILYQQGKMLHKSINVIRSAVQWLRRINHVADAVIVQREAVLIGPPLIERWFAYKKPIVFDFDDAIFLSNKSLRNGIWARLARPSNKTNQLINLSRTVWAGNRYLTDYAAQFNHNVMIVPTVVDCRIFHPRPRDADLCTLGWIGSHSTTSYLLQLGPVLERLAHKHRFRLLIVGASQPITIRGVQCINRSWQYEREVADFQTLDIGLYPIDHDEWALGKCGLKAIQYGAVGIPCVASAVGVNNEIVDDGRTGFLARSPDDWYSMLDQLLTSASLRKCLGTAARHHIVEHYSVERYQPIVTQSLQELLCAA